MSIRIYLVGLTEGSTSRMGHLVEELRSMIADVTAAVGEAVKGANVVVVGSRAQDILDEIQKLDQSGERGRLVEAATPAQAIRHVATRYRAEVATTRQVADMVTAGIKVEVAGE